MSKIGNLVVELQADPDYQFGWESAERGEPSPSWKAENTPDQARLRCQRMGWCDFHNQERGL